MNEWIKNIDNFYSINALAPAAWRYSGGSRVADGGAFFPKNQWIFSNTNRNFAKTQLNNLCLFTKAEQ